MPHCPTYTPHCWTSQQRPPALSIHSAHWRMFHGNGDLLTVQRQSPFFKRPWEVDQALSARILVERQERFPRVERANIHKDLPEP